MYSQLLNNILKYISFLHYTILYYTNIYIKHTLYYCYQANGTELSFWEICLNQAVTGVLTQDTGNLSLERGIGSHSSIIVSDSRRFQVMPY